jgi:hypothetical protein
MVAEIQSLAKFQESTDVVTTRKMKRGNGRAIQKRTSRVIESHLQTVGWISRQKASRLPADGEVFLLTSPFIELAISKCDGHRRRCSQITVCLPSPNQHRPVLKTECSFA